MRRAVGLFLALCLLMTTGCTERPGQVSEVPTQGQVSGIRLQPVVEGVARPLYVTHAGDGSGRLYVLEQAGRILMVENGELLESPFLDVTDQVLSTGMEQGLLSLAFDPNFAATGRFYLHYNAKPDGRTVVARYQVADGLPTKGDPGSAEILLEVAQPFANHNGGPLLFGPDGYLYLGLGDGGSAGDPGNRAQDLDQLLGKILRLDVSQPGAYQIPPSNPFAKGGGRPEIWSYGLRNPWRISFDRGTGDLYIADVGQSEREEIDWQPANSPGGENWGWKVWEGSKRYSEGELPNARFPVAEYSHEGGNCSITGGYLYRGKAIPALQGLYLYGDFCSGRIWGLKRVDDRWSTTLLLETEANITSFGEDEQGELYLVDRRGSIYRIIGAES